MSRRLAPIGALALLLAASGGLAGCGKMGSLDRPGPLFGGPRPAHGPLQRSQAQDPNRPVNTVDPRDESVTPAPPRTLPIPGTNSPTPNALPGALPDPYANPPR
jgi:hypothetical protein